MRIITFPAFRANGTKVELAEVLAVIPENGLVWTVLEFDGTGRAPVNLGIDAFSDWVRDLPSGYIIPWDKLKEFVNALVDTHFCVLVGAHTEQHILDAKRDADDFTPANFSTCEIFIEAFDSTKWTIWARDAELMQRMADVYASRPESMGSKPGGSFVRGGALPMEDPDE